MEEPVETLSSGEMRSFVGNLAGHPHLRSPPFQRKPQRGGLSHERQCGLFDPHTILWYFWRQIDDFRLRMYCWIFPVWFLVMFYYGMLVETRIFGEFAGLLAVVSTLIFERLVWSTMKQRMESSALEAAEPSRTGLQYSPDAH